MEKASLMRNIQRLGYESAGGLARAVREGSDHVDIMFVQKQAYLVSVGDHIDLTMVDSLKLKDGQGKNAERILEVIMTHVTIY
jgi:hypothetical protein